MFLFLLLNVFLIGWELFAFSRGRFNNEIKYRDLELVTTTFLTGTSTWLS